MRVFLDTNILVSAFITRGLCSDIFRIILSEHQLVLSDYILKELEEVLIHKINLPRNLVFSILQFLKSFEIISDHTPPVGIELRDQTDVPVLSAALNSKADVLITGDTDLLEVSQKYKMRIIDPRTFFKLVKGLNL